MEQTGSSNRSANRSASPLMDLIRSIVFEIGRFADAKVYKDEIIRYEGEIRQNARYANEPEMKNVAVEREAAIS